MHAQSTCTYLDKVWLIKKELCADLLANDLCPDVVFPGQAQPHLLQDKLYLFISFHGTECLHLCQVVDTCNHMLKALGPTVLYEQTHASCKLCTGVHIYELRLLSKDGCNSCSLTSFKQHGVEHSYIPVVPARLWQPVQCLPETLWSLPVPLSAWHVEPPHRSGEGYDTPSCRLYPHSDWQKIIA